MPSPFLLDVKWETVEKAGERRSSSFFTSEMVTLILMEMAYEKSRKESK